MPEPAAEDVAANLSTTSEGEPFSPDDELSESTVMAASSATFPAQRKTRTSFVASTRLQPLELEMDPTVSWAYKPSVLTFLGIATACIALLAYHTENLVVPLKVKRQSGLITAIAGFLLVAVINFRDGPYKRPHPAFWRAVLGTNVLYCMALVYLLWQDDEHGREFIQWFDPAVQSPPPERGYGQDCSFTFENLYNGLDLFAFAHFVGWFGKAVILRDFWACTILSVMFEIVEQSLSHQLPVFQECIWDRWLLDVCICNLGGTILGLLTCHYLEVTPFSWRGLRKRRFGRFLQPLTPLEWTRFEWKSTKRLRNYVSVVTLLTVFLLSELNVFYLKQLLWLPAEHPIVTIRLAAAFAWALPATAEFYHYVSFSKRVKRMGSHAVMLISTVLLESLIVLKWSTGKFPEPAPVSVKVFWSCFLVVLVVYPLIKFGVRGDPPSSRPRSGRTTPVATGRNTPTGRTTPTFESVHGYRNGHAQESRKGR